MYELQKLELEWKVHWMSMQELGMSDVEMGHIQMFVVFSDRGEYYWYLEWKTKGEPEQNECISANSSSRALQSENYIVTTDGWVSV